MIYTLKGIYVPNFSSLGWFALLSDVGRCWQLMADIMGKKGIFIYTLKVICVPNFSSVGWLGAELKSVKPNQQTDRHQVKQCTLRHCFAGARAWVEQLAHSVWDKLCSACFIFSIIDFHFSFSCRNYPSDTDHQYFNVSICVGRLGACFCWLLNWAIVQQIKQSRISLLQTKWSPGIK